MRAARGDGPIDDNVPRSDRSEPDISTPGISSPANSGAEAASPAAMSGMTRSWHTTTAASSATITPFVTGITGPCIRSTNRLSTPS